MPTSAAPSHDAPGGPPAETVLAPEALALLEELRGHGIAITDLHRWLGLSPDALRAWIGFSAPLRTSDALTPAIRELVILRVALSLGAGRTVRHHEATARAAGISDEQLRSLEGSIVADSFTPAQLDALTVVDLVLAGRPHMAASPRQGLSRNEAVHVAVLVAHYFALIALLKGFDIQ